MDDATRAKHERRIRAQLAVEFRDQAKRGAGGWALFERRVAELLAEAIEDIYKTAAAALFALMLIDFAPRALATVLARGSSWAERQARRVATRLASDAQKSIKSALPPKATAADIRQATKAALTRERAERIAITETTGANSQGENQARRVIEREAEKAAKKTGEELTLEVRWITEKDAKVCPICRPLHNKLEVVWKAQFPDGPPAHVNCRCDRAFVRRLRPTADRGTDAKRATT